MDLPTSAEYDKDITQHDGELDEKPGDVLAPEEDHGDGPVAGGVTLDDDEDPMKLPAWRKWIMTVLITSTTLAVTFGSSVFSSAVAVMSKEFDVSETVMLLGVSLYVVGFAFGPLLWGPLSERYGRKKPIFAAYIFFVLFQVPVAVARNLPTIFIFRFLAGAFGASAVVINNATFADYWEPSDRGKATAVYSLTVYLAPCMGPIVGSLFVQSHLGWPWTAWFTMILSCFTGFFAYTFVPETYEPELIRRKAKRLRLSIPDVAPHINFVQKYLSRPVRMMMLEPMLICMTLYISLVYGTLYLSFFAIPYSFETDRHWSSTVSSLPFLGIMVGVIVAAPALFVYSDKYYQPRLTKRGHVLPEDRLPPMMVGSIILPTGLFWFAWTAREDIHGAAQVASTTFIGAGIMLVFTCGVAFIVDIYLTQAASALAANIFVRSICAAGFPLFAPIMYHQLGTAWATSVLGFVCISLIPAPIIFYIYGARIRAKSKFTPK